MPNHDHPPDVRLDDHGVQVGPVELTAAAQEAGRTPDRHAGQLEAPSPYGSQVYEFDFFSAGQIFLRLLIFWCALEEAVVEIYWYQGLALFEPRVMVDCPPARAAATSYARWVRTRPDAGRCPMKNRNWPGIRCLEPRFRPDYYALQRTPYRSDSGCR